MKQKRRVSRKQLILWRHSLRANHKDLEALYVALRDSEHPAVEVSEATKDLIRIASDAAVSALTSFDRDLNQWRNNAKP